MSRLRAGLHFAAIGLWAQTGSGPGRIQGYAAGPSGKTIPAAGVTVRSADTGLVRSLTTDAGGNFTATALPVGVYHLDAMAPGCSAKRMTGLEVHAGETRTAAITLESPPALRASKCSRPPGGQHRRYAQQRLHQYREPARRSTGFTFKDAAHKVFERLTSRLRTDQEAGFKLGCYRDLHGDFCRCPTLRFYAGGAHLSRAAAWQCDNETGRRRPSRGELPKAGLNLAPANRSSGGLRQHRPQSRYFN